MSEMKLQITVPLRGSQKSLSRQGTQNIRGFDTRTSKKEEK